MLIATTILLPLVCALLVLNRTVGNRFAGIVEATAVLPGLALAIGGDAMTLETGPVLLGSVFGLDSTRRIFLLLTGLIWLPASLYASARIGEQHRRRFFFFWLLTMCGNTGLVLSLDMISFYTFFALMTFAGYGLIVHEGHARAFRAGRVYLVMAVAGETLLLAGMMLMFNETGTTLISEASAGYAESSLAGWILFLIFSGFGVKAAVLTLHMWLPLSYREAPVPASAVLSGPMIKAGILGWMLFLPIGHASFPGWSYALITIGLFQAYYGAILGAFQNHPKTILGYSSISQMGLFTMAAGLALYSTANGSAMLPILMLFALTHALAKSALFLGFGSAVSDPGQKIYRIGTLVLLIMVTVVIAGTPLTGGAMVKSSITELITETGEPYFNVFYSVFSLAAVGSGFILFRFLSRTFTLMKTGAADAGKTGARASRLPEAAWAVLGLMAVFLPLWIASDMIGATIIPEGIQAVAEGIWPPAAGAALAFLFRASLDRAARAETIPEGDILIPVTRLWRRTAGRIRLPSEEKFTFNVEPIIGKYIRAEGKSPWSGRFEQKLRNWQFSGIGLILIMILLLGILYFTR